MKDKKVAVVGAGIGGLATAAMLGKKGFDVTVFEKNEQPGGRCSVFEKDGFVFDMGPSWYLMPDVFEQFYRLTGEKISDHLDLIKLDPSYRVFFKDEGPTVDLSANLEKDFPVFERLEKGSPEKIKQYMKKSEEHYGIAMNKFIYKNYDSIFDFFSLDLILEGLKLNILSKMQKYVEKYVKDRRIQKLLQYQLVFLGNSPYNAPAIYNIMSHVDFNMGVFYPQGGIYKITESLANICRKNGVKIRVNSPVTKINSEDGKVSGLTLKSGEELDFDLVVSNADLHHTETQLLSPQDRSFSEKYWKNRVLAPAGLVLYLGIDGKIEGALHHNLIFSKDWKKNFSQIFDRPIWPEDPSFYICVPSRTDPSVAPQGKENVFVFVPIASDLDYTEDELSKYADKILSTMQQEMGIQDLQKRILYKRIFCVKDFRDRYNSFRGSALGLAHTLMQTAIFRPNNISKKVKGLYYVGGNTNPGIGVPMCLISAELAYKRIIGNKSAGPLSKL